MVWVASGCESPGTLFSLHRLVFFYFFLSASANATCYLKVVFYKVGIPQKKSMNSKKSSAHDAANHELSSEARAALDTFEAALKD